MNQFLVFPRDPRSFNESGVLGAEGDTWYQGPNGFWLRVPHPGVAGQVLLSTTGPNGWAAGPLSLTVPTNIRDIAVPFVMGHPAAGSVVAVGPQLQGLRMPCEGVVTGWALTSDVSTTAEVDVLAADNATWPTVGSIWGGSEPALTAARKAVVTGLSIDVDAGDLWDLHVVANSAAKQLVLTVTIRRDA